MRDLTHEQAAELLPDAALDSLAADDQTAVLAHAAACPECGPALADLRDATAQLAFALPSLTDDPVRRARVRNRLLARARADLAVAKVDQSLPDSRAIAVPTASRDVDRQGAAGRGGGIPVGPTRRAPSRRPWTASPVVAWGVAAVVGIAAVLVLSVMSVRTTTREHQLVIERAATSMRIAALQDSVASQSETVRHLTGKQVSVMQLTSGAPRAPWGWMFWDHATNHWTLVAHDLPPAAAGKTYQLWLVTPKAKISAGTFDPAADGSAEVQATYLLAPDSLRAIAVTEEPAGGVPQPTGRFVITATAGQ
jgi:hypothetical protein